MKKHEQADFDYAVALRKHVTDAYLQFAMKAIENHQNGKGQRGLSAGFQKDARLVVRAVELEMLDGTETDEWDVLYAIECAKVKDDKAAAGLWRGACLDNADRNFAEVKEAVRLANATEHRAGLAEQVADLVWKWNGEMSLCRENRIERHQGDCADELGDIPAVAKALKARERELRQNYDEQRKDLAEDAPAIRAEMAK